MKYGEYPQRANAPETVQRLTPEGVEAARQYFATQVELFPKLSDYYERRIGPDNITALSPREQDAVAAIVTPGTPIIAEEVTPRVLVLGSYEGGW